MVDKTDNKQQQERECGIYVKGVVISHQARTVRSKKDNQLYGIISHELAVQPGIVVLDRMVSPAEVPAFKLEGDEVKAYPHFELFKEIEVHAGKMREYQGKLTISNYELINAPAQPPIPAKA